MKHKDIKKVRKGPQRITAEVGTYKIINGKLIKQKNERKTK